MKKVETSDVENALYVTQITPDEWKYTKEEYPDAVYYKEANIYLEACTDFFDRSDLAQLRDEIINGEISLIENVQFPLDDCVCYYNTKTNEFIAVLKN